MNKDNKIISLDSYKRRKNTKYGLKAKIVISIRRFNEKCTLNWYTPDSNLSEDNIYFILKDILSDLTEEVPEITYDIKECYEISFTLLYYEKSKSDFAYICLPQNIPKEKLAEYLVISTSLYEIKKSGAF